MEQASLTVTERATQKLYIYIYINKTQNDHIIKRGMRLISRVGLITKWLPYSMCYNLHAYISHKQVYFAYINTYQVFLSIGNSIGIVNTCSSITRVWNYEIMCAFLLQITQFHYVQKQWKKEQKGFYIKTMDIWLLKRYSNKMTNTCHSNIQHCALVQPHFTLSTECQSLRVKCFQVIIVTV